MFSACATPSWLGDGFCDDPTNNEVCEWDGGDCCGDNVNTKYCKACKCHNGNENCFLYMQREIIFV